MCYLVKHRDFTFTFTFTFTCSRVALPQIHFIQQLCTVQQLTADQTFQKERLASFVYGTYDIQGVSDGEHTLFFRWEVCHCDDEHSKVQQR